MPGLNEAGDQFGFAVAISGGFPGLGMTAAAGAPGEDIAGVSDAGAVTIFDTQFGIGLVPQSPSIYLGAPASGVRPNIDGFFQTDDRFGFHLSSDPTTTLIVIGSPFVDLVGTDAGVVHIYGAPTTAGDPPIADPFFQLPDDQAPGNLYGYSTDFKIVGGQLSLAVGAPGATVNGQPGAGALDIATSAGDFLITQADPGVPGNAEAGDGFGVYVDGLADGTLFATAPGEDIGSKTDVGYATLLFGEGITDPGGLGAVGVHQDSAGVAGIGESGDRWGS